MLKIFRHFFIGLKYSVSSIFFLIAYYSNGASLAQVVPNQTMGSQVMQQNINGIQSSVITGGTVSGNNVFHSFSNFSVPENTGAYFSDNPGLSTIISIVTGPQASYINGILGVIGNDNLFFINSNGIIFGANSRLDLNGSLIISTADEVHFSDGFIFETDGSNTEPILTIGNPVGLVFSNNQGVVQINGNGHNIIAANSGFSPLNAEQMFSQGLFGSNNIGIFASEINFNGGILTTTNGGIALGGVKTGTVGISDINSGYALQFDISNIISAGDINLNRFAFIGISSLLDSKINIFGRNINLSDNSLIFHQNLGNFSSSIVSLKATDNINISGDSPNTPSQPQGGIWARGIATQSLSPGSGASIQIRASNLRLNENARILSQAFASGKAGDLDLDIDNSIEVLGNSIYNPTFNIGSIIGSSSATLAPTGGKTGNVRIKSRSILITGGSQISASSAGFSDGGDITINSDFINVVGYNPNSLLNSLIAATTLGAGNSGNINIFTRQLQLTDGGRIDASTLASGNAGSITIYASEFIDVTGGIPGTINPSLIIASANLVDPFIQAGLGLPAVPSGASGSISIQTPFLSVRNGAGISVRNDGRSDSGILSINADEIVLDRGTLSASTNGGNGGNIEINTAGLVLRNSQVNASATGNGNGGNTTISAQAIAGDYTSFISSNADQGTGGDIAIDTDTLIFPQANITASSNRGVDFSGNIEVSSVNFGPQQRLEIKPEKFTEPSTIACNPSSDKVSFVMTGDDIPANIDDIAETDSPIKKAPFFIDNATGEKVPLIEMQGWVDQGNGTAIPVAYNEGAFGGSYRAQACKNLAKSANESR
jgi:filamentous hemagglutinin family protein